MGIKKFFRFIKERFTEWDHISKSSEIQELIIDGSNICYQISGHGGDYRKFHSIAKAFLADNILKYEITPIVIFDGIDHDQSKMDTVYSRRTDANERISKLQEGPEWDKHHYENGAYISLISVFMDVLNSLGIRFRVADGDADSEIAAFANHHKCPVLSADSDYYMYDLKNGYIHYEDMKKSGDRVALFHVNHFLHQFRLKDPELRLVIPAVFGNDFIKSMYERVDLCDFDGCLRELAEYDTCGEYLTVGKCNRVSFEAAKCLYCSLQLPEDHDPKSTASSKVFADLPQWVIESLRKGNFQPQLLNVSKNSKYVFRPVVEDISRECAWVTSRPIRQYLYGFMGIPADQQVIEVFRDKSSPVVTRNGRPILPMNIKPPTKLSDLLHMTKEELSDLVLSVLKCHKISEDDITRVFNILPEEWKLPIAATFYWYRTCKDPIVNRHLVKSLLLSFLTCSDIPFNTKADHLSSLHAFAQWQCVYYDAISLNQLAREPFQTTSPHRFFSGEVAMYYASLVRLPDRAIKRCSDEWNLYNKFLYLVTGVYEEE